LTGAVQSWKEEDLGFEVSGRVEWTIEEGRNIEGRTRDENGNPLSDGTVLARLDREPYMLAVQSAKAELRAREAEVAAIKIELERLMPAKLKGAQAKLRRTSKEHDRQKGLFEREASTQSDLDKATAELEEAQAEVDQVQASLAAKEADLKRVEAEAGQAQQSMRQAERDLRECVLYSPFEGRVSKVSVIPGAFISPGRPVVTVVMMDPIKVEVAVSPATDRRIAASDIVQVFPPGMGQPVEGVVHTKETVADPKMRTFDLSIMVRNQQVVTNLPKDPAAAALPKVEMLTRLRRLSARADAPRCMVMKAMRQDGDGHYLWKAEGVQHGQLASSASPVLTAKRVPVQLGKRRRALLGHMMCEIADAGGLTDRDLVIVDAPDGLKDGGKVLYVRRRWLFRPGDVAHVLLSERKLESGYYVPMDAVKAQGSDQGCVFIIRDGKAKRAAVRLVGHVDDWVRIEARDQEAGKLIVAGAQLITSGVHFLIPDELVMAAKTERRAL